MLAFVIMFLLSTFYQQLLSTVFFINEGLFSYLPLSVILSKWTQVIWQKQMYVKLRSVVKFSRVHARTHARRTKRQPSRPIHTPDNGWGNNKGDYAACNLLGTVVVSERMQWESGDLQNPSTIHVTVSTGQVTVWLEHRLVQIHHSLALTHTSQQLQLQHAHAVYA